MTTILLVNDDPMQASLMLSTLERRFGEVRRVSDAAEALCLIEQPDFARTLGLVISWHQATGIGGPAFVAELRARMPHLPILVLGTGDAAPAEYPNDDVAFLPKAFATESLLTLTGQMLAHAKPGVA